MGVGDDVRQLNPSAVLGQCCRLVGVYAICWLARCYAFSQRQSVANRERGGPTELDLLTFVLRHGPWLCELLQNKDGFSVFEHFYSGIHADAVRDTSPYASNSHE